MNPFLLPLSQLLQNWKDLRNDLKNKTDDEKLAEVVKFWSYSPLATFAHDPDRLDTYDTPWEMMHQNDWCRNSVAVAMDFTLRLSGVNADRLRVKMIRDHDVSDQKLIVEVDGKYWLNYEHGTVSTIPNTNWDCLDTWKFSGKKYERV